MQKHPNMTNEELVTMKKEEDSMKSISWFFIILLTILMIISLFLKKYGLATLFMVLSLVFMACLNGIYEKNDEKSDGAEGGP